MRCRCFPVALSLCVVWTLSAAPITYDISVDTSSVSGTDGSLDLQLNPGPLVTQLASLQILNFSSNGSLAGSPSVSGDVTGVLPATLTFDNLTGFNDYFEGFTFGSTLSFQISLFGPALSSPNGTSTSGSAFAFSMFADTAGTLPILTSDPDGSAVILAVNLDGTTTPTNFSNQTSIVPQTSAVPEPTGLALAAIPLMFLILRALWVSESTSHALRSLRGRNHSDA
jgi:hypothetical protein